MALKSVEIEQGKLFMKLGVFWCPLKGFMFFFPESVSMRGKKGCILSFHSEKVVAPGHVFGDTEKAKVGIDLRIN